MESTYVGIDLAVDPFKCGICVLKGDEVAFVGRGRGGTRHPDWLADHCLDAQVVAVDVPFGWPRPFVKALAGYEIGVALDRIRRRYTYRQTDAWVADELPLRLTRELGPPVPFSVSTDKLGATAMVGTVLLNGLSRDFHLSPRMGATLPAVIEVYPTLSLWAWTLPHRKYKGNSETARDKRRVILWAVREAFDLTMSEEAEGDLVRSDHCFDALIAALTAREYEGGATFDPPEHFADEILRSEGWIRVPSRRLGEPRSQTTA